MEIRQNPRRVAFVDLDDTLLGPDKSISAANLDALHQLRSKGVLVAVASGRHHHNISSFDDIGQQDWILSSHGSVVRHERTGEVLLELTMAPADVAKVCGLGRANGFSLVAYHKDGAYIERPTAWTELYARKAGWKPQIVDFRDLPAEGFQKVIWTDEPERITRFAASARTEFAGRFNVMITDAELLEFIAPVANKAVGAQALIEKLGINARDTLAFGDGNNDVELLRWAGVSVAMNHGRPSARSAARFITPPGPRENAFARAVDLALRRAA
jgi:Cof subfamily protein (haloacid dehalogenase superfamily)